MTSTAEKLLARLRRTTTGWSRQELLQLLEGHNFVRRRTARHGELLSHPDHPERSVVLIPRDRESKQYVARRVLQVIELVIVPKGSQSE